MSTVASSSIDALSSVLLALCNIQSDPRRMTTEASEDAFSLTTARYFACVATACPGDDSSPKTASVNGLAGTSERRTVVNAAELDAARRIADVNVRRRSRIRLGMG